MSKKISKCIYLEENVLEFLKKIATHDDRSVSKIINNILRDFIKQVK